MARETSSRRIAALIVGREPGWREAIRGALAPLGVEIVGADGREEALRAVRGRAFDLAIVALAGSPDVHDLPALVAKAAPGLLVVVAAGNEASGAIAGAVRQAREAARSALVRLANHLVHDLNNPLGGLKLYVRLLERSLAQAKTEEATELVGKIGRAVDQLTEILVDIRRYEGLPPSERAGTRLETLLEACLAPSPAGEGD